MRITFFAPCRHVKKENRNLKRSTIQNFKATCNKVRVQLFTIHMDEMGTFNLALSVLLFIFTPIDGKNVGMTREISVSSGTFTLRH